MPFLGGHKILRIAWDGQHALGVEFSSVYTDRYYQLYVGRHLAGVTRSVGDRRVVGQAEPNLIPAPVLLLAVELSERNTDFGADLPERPWNQYRLDWSATSYPADAAWFDITGSRNAGEASDPTNLLARIPYVGDLAYRFDLPPLAAGGEWEYTLTPRDDALPEGNAGTADSVTIDARVYPPDVAPRDDGTRFAIAASGGVLTATFEYQEV